MRGFGVLQTSLQADGGGCSSLRTHKLLNTPNSLYLFLKKKNVGPLSGVVG